MIALKQLRFVVLLTEMTKSKSHNNSLQSKSRFDFMKNIFPSIPTLEGLDEIIRDLENG